MSTVVAPRALLFAHPDAAGEWVWSIAVEAQLTPRRDARLPLLALRRHRARVRAGCARRAPRG